MTKETLKSIARHGLTTAGGALVAQGIGNEAIMTEAVGVIIALIGLTWSILEKRGRDKALNE